MSTDLKKRQIRARMKPADQSVTDGKALAQRLIEKHESTDGNESQKRLALLEMLKAELEAATALTKELFDHGRLDGIETARRISDNHTALIEALYLYITTSLHPNPNPSKAEHMAVCAVGGFGRGEMAPFSDLDLLFLHADKKPSVWVENVTEHMLYLLWDLGKKVGQSTRSVAQCISLSREDQTILTSMLDLRYISGDENLYAQLSKRFSKEIAKGKGKTFIRAKLEERDERHNREGNSRYVIEPNVKEGKGGLRDLHVLYWIARYLSKIEADATPQQSQDYVELGLFDAAAADRFERAADFLWRTRIALHYQTGRPTDNLTFDHQTVLARQMGHASGPVEVAVERFMREYFTNAREVGALTRIACAKLEESRGLLPAVLERVLPSRRKSLKDPAFHDDGGRVNFRNPMYIRENPGLILRLFQLAGEYNLDVHPDALSEIDFRRNLIDNAYRKDPKNAEIFFDILIKSQAPGAVMKLMNEAGVLGRYLIEFGGIVARTQFNMHHAYTVDEHTIGLVRYFNDLEKGFFERENPLATEFVKDFSTSQRRILYMACLLHDTGKGVGDQCIEGARLARRACNRMGMDKDETETVCWLIRHHLDMSETAQRRDVSDPETISKFAELVGSRSRLQMLMALTIVDIRAVGPGIWNDWKGVLIRELYKNTSALLESRPEMEPKSRTKTAKQTLTERLPENIATPARDYLFALPDSYWLGTDLKSQLRHARFIHKSIEAGHSQAAHARLDKPRDITELWVMSEDRPGLFSDITGAISACGASIAGARLFTSPTGHVFDIFFLQNSDGLAFGRDAKARLDRLCAQVTQALKGKGKTPEKSVRISSRARAIPITPAVRWLHQAATEGTPERYGIEVEGRDRSGLLYDLAQTISDAGLAVESAHIEVVGVMAVDTFYVSKIDKSLTITDELKSELTEALMSVLSEDK